MTPSHIDTQTELVVRGTFKKRDIPKTLESMYSFNPVRAKWQIIHPTYYPALSFFAQTWVSIPWPFASDWECISSPQSSRVLLLNCHAGKDPQNCSVYLKWPKDHQVGELLYYMHWKLFCFVIFHPSTILIYNNNLLSFYYVPGTVLRYLHDFEYNLHINPT